MAFESNYELGDWPGDEIFHRYGTLPDRDRRARLTTTQRKPIVPMQVRTRAKYYPPMQTIFIRAVDFLTKDTKRAMTRGQLQSIKSRPTKGARLYTGLLALLVTETWSARVGLGTVIARAGIKLDIALFHIVMAAAWLCIPAIEIAISRKTLTLYSAVNRRRSALAKTSISRDFFALLLSGSIADSLPAL
jgi:hypothetical protein